MYVQAGQPTEAGEQQRLRRSHILVDEWSGRRMVLWSLRDGLKGVLTSIILPRSLVSIPGWCSAVSQKLEHRLQEGRYGLSGQY
jgi:hypothetical protein